MDNNTLSKEVELQNTLAQITLAQFLKDETMLQALSTIATQQIKELN